MLLVIQPYELGVTGGRGCNTQWRSWLSGIEGRAQLLRFIQCFA